MKYDNLVSEVVSKLCALGKPDSAQVSLLGGYEIQKIVQCLPNENLEKIKSTRLSKYKEVDELVQQLGRRGYLSFDPYIGYTADKQPILIVRYNRFVVLEHGHFKIFAECNNFEQLTSEYYRSSLYLGDVLHEPKGESAMCEILYYPLYETCSSLQAFVDFINNKPDKANAVIEKFINDSISYLGVPWSFETPKPKWFYSDSDASVSEHVYRLVREYKDVCRFYFVDSKVHMFIRMDNEKEDTHIVMSLSTISETVLQGKQLLAALLYLLNYHGIIY